MTQLSDKSEYAVVIPVFNGAKTLARALESIKSQTLQATQIIVVNDNSSDKSGEIALDFGAELVVNSSNLGSGASRSLGLLKVKTPYVALLDADDYWSSNPSEILLKWMHEFEADIVGSLLMPESSQDSSALTRKIELLAREDSTRILTTRDFLRGSPLPNSATMFRTSVIRDIGGWVGSKFCEDYEVLVDGLFLGFRIARVVEFTGIYGVGPDQKSAQILNQIYGQARVLKKLLHGHPDFSSAEKISRDRLMWRVVESYLARMGTSNTSQYQPLIIEFETRKFREKLKLVNRVLASRWIWNCLSSMWRFLQFAR